MKDNRKPKVQLTNELEELRQRIAKLEELRAQQKQQSERELRIRNQIDHIFLTVPDDETYGEVLQVILQAMESKYGVFGYINEDGALVCPSMTRGIWEQGQISDKNIAFPLETWGGIWGRALKEKKTLYSNKTFRVPEGHIPILRSLDVPIIHKREVIGNILVGNKATDYDKKGIQLLETIADHIAPILYARLQRDRKEKERMQAESERERILQNLEERHKELSCLYGIDKIYRRKGITTEELLKKVVKLIPPSWQYPEITGTRITFEGKKYKTRNFKVTKWMQREDIIINNKKAGLIEVCYLEEKPESDEGPFPKEERNLIITVSERLGQIIERKKAEERYQDLIEKEKDIIYALDNKGNITFASPAVETILGYRREELIGKNFMVLIPKKLQEKTGADFNNLLKTGEITAETVLLDKKGQSHFIEYSSTVIKEGEKVVGTRGIARDITERKRAEEQIKASLEEKEVLLREIHHRVKNNLQIISSLIKLQSQYLEGKRYVDILKDSQNRIKSMSLIHEMLYQSKHLSKINFKKYTRTLTNYLFRSCWDSPGKIALKIESENVYLPVDNAIPCGLILHELVSNSLKHAFPDGKEGEIKIALHSINEKDIELVVSDDGVGIPEDLDFRNTKSLGLHLVTILAEDQLHGEIKLDKNKGTEFQIKLRGVK